MLVRLAITLIVAAGFIAYANSYSGEFVFDDNPAILQNPNLEHVWPGMQGFITRGRTITELTFSLNYAAEGLEPRGYHLLNIVIHILAGLTLFGVVRRTLQLERFRVHYRTSGTWLALIIAVLWLLHPLQTESVTYVIQRAESLMGLFYLLTLYCTIRSATGDRPLLWQGLAVLACAFGMGSKPVMVTAPLVVLLFDRVFLAETWKGIVRLRGAQYVGLSLTWAVVAVTGLPGMLVDPGKSERNSVGFGMADVTVLDYLLTQPGVILHYLRLSVWPHPLVLDYGWPIVRSIPRALPGVLALVVLCGASVVALARRSGLGYLGVWFFTILAPTSSIVPLRDAAFEHRMYLPLAAVVVGGALLGHTLMRRLIVGRILPASTAHGLAIAFALAAALALGARTFARNRDYHDDIALWRSTIRDVPENGRLYILLGRSLTQQGRDYEAIDVLRTGLGRLASKGSNIDDRVYRGLTINLANMLFGVGHLDETIGLYRAVLEVEPENVLLHRRLGDVLARLGRLGEAVQSFQAAIAADPADSTSYYEFGMMYRYAGDPTNALAAFREAQRIDPDNVEATSEAGRLLIEEFSNWVEAEQAYRAILARRSQDPSALTHLGFALEKQEKLPEAIEAYTDAVQIQPENARAQYALGRCLETQGHYDRAAQQYEHALRLMPDNEWAAEALQRAQRHRSGS